MDIYQHTLNWFKGEIFEGQIIMASGIILVILSIIIRKFGTTPNAKSLFIPLLVVGLLFSIGIGSMMLNYSKRMDLSKHAFQENPKEFIMAESKRIDDFQVLYKYSVGFAAVSFLLTIIAFGFLDNRHFQSICIALMIVSMSLIIIDHFSKERAKIYHIEIKKVLHD